MDLSKIYSKTGKGTRALSAKSKDLPKNALKVLPLIDSKTSVRGILDKLGKFGETDLHILLTQLESGGYIRALQDDTWDTDNGQSANPSSMVVEEVSHEDFFRIDDAPSPATPAEAAPTEPEAGEAALQQAQRVYHEFAERLAKETQKQAEQEAQIKAVEAEQKAREEAQRKVAEERARLEAEAAAAREAERLVKAEEARQAELAKILFEAEHAARLEAERVAREKAERAARLAEEARLRIEAEAREAAEKLALEEAKRKLREEEEARKQVEAERKAREAAEKQARKEEEARLKAEAKEKARLEKAAKEQAERLAREQAKLRAREEEEARSKAEAERISREQAEQKARREEEARLKAEADEKARREKAAQGETERQAREQARQRALEEEELRRKAEADRIAREEAERDARRAEEARQKAEADARTEAERQARLAAEAQAKAEAAQRALEEKEAARKAEAERRAQQEAALQARKAEEAQRKLEAAEAKRQAKEEARREAEALAQIKLEQKEQARAERVARKIATTRQRKRTSEAGRGLARLARAILLYLPVALVLLIVALHYVNLAPFAAPVARAASASLGEPVRFDELHASLLPQPELRLNDVQVGQDDVLQFGMVRIEFALATLFEPTRRVDRLEIENASLPAAELERMQRWFHTSSTARQVEISSIAFKNIAFVAPDLKLPAIMGNVELAPDGSFGAAHLETQEGNLSLKLQPANESWKFSMDARAWQPPVRTALKFDEFRAEGVLQGQTAKLETMAGSIYAGTFKGSSMIAWKDRPRITGRFIAENMHLEQVVAEDGSTLGIEGALSADVTFSSASENVQGLAESPVANARFTVADGKILGIDLSSSMLPANRERSTRFDKLTGTLQSDAAMLHFRQLVLESPQLRARGQADVSSAHEVNGKVTAELLIPSRRMQASFGLGGKVGDMWIK